MRTVSGCTIFLLLILLSFGAMGQDPHFTSIDANQGLPNNSVYDIFQDKSGYIWVTTNDGLARYDGATFTSFKSSRQSLLSGSEIKQDGLNRIWYQNFDGQLFYIDKDSLIQFDYDNEKGYTPYTVTKNHLFITTTKGIDVYELKSLQFLKSFELDQPNIFYLNKKDETIYFYLNQALFTIDSTLSITGNRITGSEEGVVYFSEIIDSKIFLFPRLKTDARALILNLQGQTLATTTVAPQMIAQNLTLTDNHIWINTSAGTYRLNEDYSYTPFFQNENITCVIQDREKNYWFGSGNRGIKLVTNFNNRAIIRSNESYTKTKLIGDNIFATNSSNEIVELNTKTGILKKRKKLGQDREVYMFFKDEESGYSYASSDYFYILDPAFKVKKTLELSVKAMCDVDEKYLAFSASGISALILKENKDHIKSPWDNQAGLQKLQNGLKVIPLNKSQRGKDIEYIASKNRIYLLTNKGLFSYSPSEEKNILHNGNAIHARQIHVYENELIILKNDGTIWTLDHKNEFSLLPIQTSSSITQCKVHGEYLFVLSQEKILCYNFKTKVIYPVQIDLNSIEVQDICVKENDLFLAHSNGILKCDWTEKLSDLKEIYFDITKLSVNNKNYNPLVIHEFENDQNSIIIEYSLLHYNLSVLADEYYRINEGPWRLVQNGKRQIMASDLAPGNYTVEFKIGNLLQPEKIQFRVLQPFWLRSWFIILVIIIAIAAVYLVDQWKIIRLQKKYNALQEKNELLESNILLEQSLSKSMLTSIRAQMNPHFFYNALNTIHAYIFNNDKQKAGSYLVKFSKLTRMILEMSEREYVSLSEEIKSLQLYLDLEKMRFVSDFDFIINEENLGNADVLEIPSMIVQPFVENAIKHGLHHKKEDRKLTLDFESEGDLLKIIIDDNGVGRERSRKLNEKRKDHQSFSISAIDKRIELINHRRPNSIKVETLDKYNTSGMPLGTKVTITIQTKFHR
ncbi:histidine kinase [Emticicia oligotrophica]|uniref:sensor histidine kinase n=1 Tax=Emticicia oligotrophica TaxID=312279 RepID=UPI00273AA556|nr:histidine kinase [Emticicia oligotrophica]